MLSICGGGQNTLLDGVQQVFNALRRFRKLFFQKGNVGVLPPLEVHQLVRQRLHDGIIVHHAHGLPDNKLLYPLFLDRFLVAPFPLLGGAHL